VKGCVILKGMNFFIQVFQSIFTSEKQAFNRQIYAGSSGRRHCGKLLFGNVHTNEITSSICLYLNFKSFKKMATKKAKKKAPAKAKAKAKPASKAKAAPKAKAKVKRKPNAAFMKPMNISTALQPIVGSKPIPRTEVTKRLWVYIKKNKLQDPKEKRNINADENLKKIFNGKKQVSMFEMTKLVSKHLS
jgi:hypothetical protein